MTVYGTIALLLLWSETEFNNKYQQLLNVSFEHITTGFASCYYNAMCIKQLSVINVE